MFITCNSLFLFKKNIMEEKDVLELSTEIVEGITKLAMGAETGLFSNKVMKSLIDHPKFEELKTIFTTHISKFKGEYKTTEELKELSDFRYNIVSTYQSVKK